MLASDPECNPFWITHEVLQSLPIFMPHCSRPLWWSHCHWLAQWVRVQEKDWTSWLGPCPPVPPPRYTEAAAMLNILPFTVHLLFQLSEMFSSFPTVITFLMIPFVLYLMCHGTWNTNCWLCVLPPICPFIQSFIYSFVLCVLECLPS